MISPRLPGRPLDFTRYGFGIRLHEASQPGYTRGCTSDYHLVQLEFVEANVASTISYPSLEFCQKPTKIPGECT